MVDQYAFTVTHCPVCGRPIPSLWYDRHVKRAHPDIPPDPLADTDVDEDTIRKSAKTSYYGWQEFQREQHEES